PLFQCFIVNISKTKQALQSYLDGARKAKLRIALVPTMGALHEGHLSLIKEAQKIADVVVCSIFVNPTQFNDPQDLEKYPRPEENDLRLLQEVGCDIVFLPTVDEMYPSTDEPWHLDLGKLEQVWEGEKRPGHFQGVTQIVYKLFQLVEPDVACFGQKDFQQVMVIQRLIDLKNLSVSLHIAQTAGSSSRLALRPCNMRHAHSGKQESLARYSIIDHIQQHIETEDEATRREEALRSLDQEGQVAREYLEV